MVAMGDTGVASYQCRKVFTILCDMDGIIVNLFTYWLDAIEQEYGVKVEPHEIVRWDLHNCGRLKELGAAKVYGFLSTPGFFRNAPALPGALEGLKKLHDAGHKIVILSSPSGPISAKEKLEWLAEKLPWLSDKNIMLANQKTMVKGDILIDDHPDTIVRYSETWPEAAVIGIRYPYNEAVPCNGTRIQIVDSYMHMASAWETIVAYVGRLSMIHEDPVF
jgi:5'-nucleotidase